MTVNEASENDVASSDRRKLVAVVYADMVGYSRLIGLDDVGTLERLRRLRRELIDPAIEEHGGDFGWPPSVATIHTRGARTPLRGLTVGRWLSRGGRHARGCDLQASRQQTSCADSISYSWRVVAQEAEVASSHNHTRSTSATHKAGESIINPPLTLEVSRVQCLGQSDGDRDAA